MYSRAEWRTHGVEWSLIHWNLYEGLALGIEYPILAGIVVEFDLHWTGCWMVRLVFGVLQVGVP